MSQQQTSQHATSEGPARPRTAVDALAESHFEAALELEPLFALSIGAAEVAPGLGDRSPAGAEALADLARCTLARLRDAEPVDDVDRVTVAALRERLGLDLELHEAGETLAPLNVIASPVQELRMVFDLLPTDTPEQWEEVARRLADVPAAVTGYVESLRTAAAAGRVAARRQVVDCAAEAAAYGRPGGFFDAFAAAAAPTAGTLPDATRERLRTSARAAAGAYADLARTLQEELLPRAPEADAAGADRYRLWSRYFLGAQVDLAETYAWGLEEVTRIREEMRQVAAEVVPGGGVAEAVAALDADPALSIEGAEAFRDWMQARSDATVEALAGTHFDIPEQVRRLECRIAPTTSGGIYYTGPSEDFSRPGRMWWAVPEGVTRFTTWREATTVHHEGVPGHHLQVGQVAARSDVLNRWRRYGCWVSGHGEGWALYAERLMHDLGHLHGPGEVMGMLEGQLLRAGRVVVDIGVHCGFEAPPEAGGGRWDYDKAWGYLRSTATMEEAMLRYELHRYLGWPGQAPSYKVGERLWTALRDETRAREGAAFDAVAFHRRALDVGSVGLDVLRAAVLPR
ncbi:uncharacterized protein (DUF885 family) [Kineococcus xinjiangensis]|uniref:Uncharacterized protein (DUF885 family) n=1 Tax=Kineococcus xinjiangensis TaxID=512762 RepID=A0A2S6ITX8_9ACTN|nr:DUF885 domain-containing protein [Kineococcus xinjiangensis]PPK97707.1 uncharacterized protein (DUF885 family) [Kineococcus xinjiangensis]